MLRKSMGLAVVALALLAAACAPKQRIPLQVSPRVATLYVDGTAQDFIPDELVLRSDRAHVLFFKSEGYRPVRVVLESIEVQGKPRLAPYEVSVDLERAARGEREVRIEPAADD